LSDKDGKKRDISDLKARLGLKKGGGSAASAKGTESVPTGAPARARAGYVPPPPGVAPPQPAQPVVPDARTDPFGAMNAMAAHGAQARAPEIIVVDKQHVEQVAPQSNVARYGKIAGIILAPLIVGFILGGINHARSQYNATLRDAKDLYAEFQQIGKTLEGLNNVLLTAKERGGDGKAYALADKQLVADLEALNFTIPDSDQLILYHANLYQLDPKLVQDILLFYSRAKTLATKVKEHARLSKDLDTKLPPEARAKLGADTSFAAVLKMPTADEAQKGARPSAELVQIGSPVCADGRPSPGGCPEGALQGFQVRGDTAAPWSTRTLAAGTETADKVIFLRRSGVLQSLLSGSPRFLDELQYYQRLSEIDTLVSGGTGDGGLVKERKDIEDRLNAVAQKSKAFAI
jgi:hypothetical protein